jgi:hypothetical protein
LFEKFAFYGLDMELELEPETGTITFQKSEPETGTRNHKFLKVGTGTRKK